jgi:hypothetical protein
VLTRLHWPNLSKKEAKKELLLGSGLLDKDNTKQNLKLTWLADRYLLETLFFFYGLDCKCPRRIRTVMTKS